MFHHAKTKTTTTIKQVNFNWLMNQNTTGVNFELIDNNNRSENAAKNNILRGTANLTSENTFSL